MRHSHSLSWIFFAEDGDAGGTSDVPAADASAETPADDVVTDEVTDDAAETVDEDELASATDEELDALEGQLSEEFSALYDAGSPDASATARMAEIADDIDQLRAEKTRRETERAEQQKIADDLKSRVVPTVTEADAAAATAADDATSVVAEAEQALEPVAASATPRQNRPKRRGLSASLSAARSHAPAVTIEPSGTERGSQLVITAAAEVANILRGGQVSDLEVLASATVERARVLGDSSGRVQVAQIRREFEHTIDRTMSATEIMSVMKAAANPQVLADNMVASGGWCAPNIPMFNFFNIACEDSLLDLPTVGIERAGIEWPVSPSIADFLGTNSVWHWTETDDQAAATGAPTKPCVHVPCPDLDNERLAADGICVTAGFLQEAAWPELVENHLSLTMSAHVHTINALHIAQVVSLSTAVTMVEDSVGAIAPLLTAIDLQAIDYREKYAMCEGDILEVVLPRWVKGLLRSDAAYRPGVSDLFCVTDAEFAAWAACRNVRIQYVTDWQTRAGATPGQDTALTSFPNSVKFLIYAAGTFVRGNGAKIDLGVIRDSTLNETNDYTASWTEEATLIAMIGHESRVVTVDSCASGAVGIGTALTCV